MTYNFDLEELRAEGEALESMKVDARRYTATRKAYVSAMENRRYD